MLDRYTSKYGSHARPLGIANYLHQVSVPHFLKTLNSSVFIPKLTNMYVIPHFKNSKERGNDISFKYFVGSRLVLRKPYNEVYYLAITIE